MRNLSFSDFSSRISGLVLLLFIYSCNQSTSSPQGNIQGDLSEVATFAGSGGQGLVNGTGANAQFSLPSGIAIYSNGDLFVADSGNHVIRKITSGGVVTTFAGSGGQGLVNGTGANAEFSLPMGVAVDGTGNLFIADRGNHVIRKITSSGVVTTFAGSGGQGLVNDTGTNAQFSLPSGIAINSNGDLFVADSGNHAIRKVSSSSSVTVFAGNTNQGDIDDKLLSCELNTPLGLVIDQNKRIFLVEYGNHKVKIIK